MTSIFDKRHLQSGDRYQRLDRIRTGLCVVLQPSSGQYWKQFLCLWNCVSRITHISYEWQGVQIRDVCKAIHKEVTLLAHGKWSLFDCQGLLQMHLKHTSRKSVTPSNCFFDFRIETGCNGHPETTLEGVEKHITRAGNYLIVLQNWWKPYQHFRWLPHISRHYAPKIDQEASIWWQSR